MQGTRATGESARVGEVPEIVQRDPRKQVKALIVGAGPVACLAAVKLLHRGIQVEMVDRGPDVRTEEAQSGYSFNLTLTYRGLYSLSEEQRRRIYDLGVVLTHRTIHHRDSEVAYQPYGITPDQHLLSIPRTALHRSLLEEAVELGAEVHFGQTCVMADIRRTRATFLTHDGEVRTVSADLLLGCDGANSLVRHDMAKHGARMKVVQEFIPHGHIELSMDVTSDVRALPGDRPDEGVFGMHIWPRGGYFLQAQPNADGSYTVALFMPLDQEGDDLSFTEIPDRPDVRSFFRSEFADIEPMLPRLGADLFENAPAPLRMVRVDPFTHRRTVLLGDAAHTMVPFYGQGINCSFEDVGVLFSLADRYRMRSHDVRKAMIRAMARFSELRVEPDHAITDLSLANLHELSAQSGQDTFQARKQIELRLSREHPDDFMTLYEMVAFSSIPYHKVIERNRRQENLLDELCARHDVWSDGDVVIGEYLNRIRERQPRRRRAEVAGTLAASQEAVGDLVTPGTPTPSPATA